MKHLFPDISRRSNCLELMDDPGCDEARLLRTVRQFASINRLVSRYRTILGRWVLDDMMRQSDRAYHLLELGAGGCDIAAWLLSAARKRGLRLRVTACDMDPRILRYARTTYGSVEGLSIQERNVLNDQLGDPVDYLFANHFLHHLNDEAIVRLFRIWSPRVNRRMVFSDLHRTASAWISYRLFSLPYRNSFARYDGRLSIQRGFRSDELIRLVESADTGRVADLFKLIPGRLVLSLETPAPQGVLYRYAGTRLCPPPIVCPDSID